MQSWAGVGLKISVFYDEEVASGVGGNDLEGERAETEGVEMAGAVIASGDGVEGRSVWRLGRTLCENVLESGGREDRRGGFEEGAAVDGHGGMVVQGTGNREQPVGQRREFS